MSRRSWMRTVLEIREKMAAVQALADGGHPLMAGAFLWCSSPGIRQALAVLDADQAAWGEAIITAMSGEALGLAPMLHRFFGIGPEPCHGWTEAVWWRRTFGDDQVKTAALFRAELKRRPAWLKGHRAELREWMPVVLAVAEVAEARP